MNPMRDILRPNPGHYIVTAKNPTGDPLRHKILDSVEDTMSPPLDSTINTLEITLCKQMGSVRFTETNLNFPLKYRDESRNEIDGDHCNQTLVQSDNFNTKITRYLGEKSLSQIDKENGMCLYLPNGEDMNQIILYKFKAEIDLALITRMKWIVYPTKALEERVYIRAKTFDNRELHWNVPCIKQLQMGMRKQQCNPIVVSHVSHWPRHLNFEERTDRDPQSEPVAEGG